jgi:hypothetical protein
VGGIGELYVIPGSRRQCVGVLFACENGLVGGWPSPE